MISIDKESFLFDCCMFSIENWEVYTYTAPVAPNTALLTRLEQQREQKLSPQCRQYCYKTTAIFITNDGLLFETTRHDKCHDYLFEKNLGSYLTLIRFSGTGISLNITSFGARAKILASRPSTATTLKGSTRVPFLGTGTGVNRILSVPAFFPNASIHGEQGWRSG